MSYSSLDVPEDLGGIVKTRSFRHLLVHFSSPLVQQTVLGYSVSPVAAVTNKHCLENSGEAQHCTNTGSLSWIKRTVNQASLWRSQYNRCGLEEGTECNHQWV